MQAGLLIVLPPFMFGVMLLVNRHYAMTLLDYPRVLGATVLSMVIGALWIRRIVNVEF